MKTRLKVVSESKPALSRSLNPKNPNGRIPYATNLAEQQLQTHQKRFGEAVLNEPDN